MGACCSSDSDQSRGKIDPKKIKRKEMDFDCK